MLIYGNKDPYRPKTSSIPSSFSLEQCNTSHNCINKQNFHWKSVDHHRYSPNFLPSEKTCLDFFF